MKGDDIMKKREYLTVILTTDNCDNGYETTFVGIFDANPEGLRHILTYAKWVKEELMETYETEDVSVQMYVPTNSYQSICYDNLKRWLNGEQKKCYLHINRDDYEWDTITIVKSKTGSFYEERWEQNYQRQVAQNNKVESL